MFQRDRMIRTADVRRRYTANAVSPGVIYSSPNLDPPYYFEGDPMAMRAELIICKKSALQYALPPRLVASTH